MVDLEKKKATDLAYRIANRDRHNAQTLALQRRKMADPAYRDMVNARERARRKKNREMRNAKRRAEQRVKRQDAAFREKTNAAHLKWRNRHRIALRERARIYTEKNREQIKVRRQARLLINRKDPNLRMKKTLGTRLRHALNGLLKSAKTLELLGCTIEFLREHLEKQFVPGMTWENYGPVWHVDHILPCAEFHLQHSEEQEICFHWTNLQPLFAAENLSKGDRII